MARTLPLLEKRDRYMQRTPATIAPVVERIHTNRVRSGRLTTIRLPVHRVWSAFHPNRLGGTCFISLSLDETRTGWSRRSGHSTEGLAPVWFFGDRPQWDVLSWRGQRYYCWRNKLARRKRGNLCFSVRQELTCFVFSGSDHAEQSL